LELYQIKLREQLPQLAQPMKQLQVKRYPFLKNDSSIELSLDQTTITVEEFIDELYSRKQEGNYLE